MAYEWDPSKTHSNFTLSNANRTVTCNTAGTAQSAISDWARTSGKWYWEIDVDTLYSYYTSIGFCDQSGDTDFTKNIRTGWNESWAINLQSSAVRVYHDGSYWNLSETVGEGDIVMIAIDIDAGKAWMGKNGTWWDSGDPANGTDPLWNDSTIIGNSISAAVSLRYINDKMTSQFISAQLTYTPPSGFSALGALTELEDASLNLEVMGQGLEDLSSFLRAHDGVELHDFQAVLEAQGWRLEDLASFLSAYHESMDDADMDLQTWGTHYDDMKQQLAAWHQHMEDMKSSFETWATKYDDAKAFLEAAGWHIEDLGTWLSTYGQEVSHLSAWLHAAKDVLKDLAMFLYAASGEVLGDLGCFLYAGDGEIKTDLGLKLHVISSVPVFKSTTAQRVSSVVSEVA